METPLFFKNNDYNLFGVLHAPKGTSSPLFPAPCTLNPVISPLHPQPSTLASVPSTLPPVPSSLGIVFCHPFAEEKLLAHRVMVNLARALCANGHHVLRFDYLGHGDSSGYFEDATVQTRLSDIKKAVEYLKEQSDVKRVALLGVRLGAALACLVNVDGNVSDDLILISPIIDGKAYVEQCLRSNLTTQLATFKKVTRDRKQLIDDLLAGQHVNIDGYLLSGVLYRELQSINLLATIIKGQQSVLLIHTARKDNEPPDQNLQALCKYFSALGNYADLISIKAPYFWTDTKIYTPRISTLETTVINWLNKSCIST